MAKKFGAEGASVSILQTTLEALAHYIHLRKLEPSGEKKKHPMSLPVHQESFGGGEEGMDRIFPKEPSVPTKNMMKCGDQ